MTSGRTTDRRNFIRTAAATGILANTAFAGTSQVPAGKKIRVGHIGCGNLALNAYIVAMQAAPTSKSSALATLFPPGARAGQEIQHPKALLQRLRPDYEARSSTCSSTPPRCPLISR